MAADLEELPQEKVETEKTEETWTLLEEMEWETETLEPTEETEETFLEELSQAHESEETEETGEAEETEETEETLETLEPPEETEETEETDTKPTEHNRVVWQFENNWEEPQDMPKGWSAMLEKFYQSTRPEHCRNHPPPPQPFEWEEDVVYVYDFRDMTQTRFFQGGVGRIRKIRRARVCAPYY